MSELDQVTLQQHQQWMRRAIALAQQGQYSTRPNPNVGCVIVKDGQLVGEGFHPKAGQPHAEVFAMRDAGEAARGATAYVTLEPCVMCSGALSWSQISKVVIGARDEQRGFINKGLSLHPKTEVVTGVLEKECSEIVKDFFKNKRYHQRKN